MVGVAIVPSVRNLLANDLRQQRWLLLGGLTATLGESLLSLAVPWLGGRVAEGLTGALPSSLPALLTGLLALLTGQAVLRATSGYCLGRATSEMLASLRNRLFKHLLSLPLNYFQQRKLGDTLAILTHDVTRLSQYATHTSVTVVSMLFTVIGAAVLMWRIDWALAVCAIVAVPIFYLLMKIVGRELRPLASQLNSAYAATLATAEESLSMLPAVKVFTRERLIASEFARLNSDVLRIEKREQRIYALLGPGMQWMASIAIVVVLWIGGDRLANGTLGVGGLVTFLLYAGLLTRPVSALSDLYGQTQSARVSIERISDVLNEAAELLEVGEELTQPVRGEIEFRDVSFAYPDRAPCVENFLLHISAGQTIALTGANGSGKTTLINLLTRLITPESGAVLVDGQDIAKVSLRSLRGAIGVVTQNVLLANGTVRENIQWGRDDATQGDIEHAALSAQAHDFILALPNRYDTVIGDQGVRLSGRQRQRLALARALLKDPPILVLDEATSMFDPDGEASLIESCGEVLRNRTVIIITHRPAALALADRVIPLS